MPITGYRELSEQLTAMGDACGTKTLRSAAYAAMKPALDAARIAIPVGDPPYHEGAGIKGGVYGKGAIKTVDPYPRKTFRGRHVTPGFSRRSIGRKAVIAPNGRVVVMLGVGLEAYTALQFVEFGTSKMQKHPWLEPSFRSSVGRVDAKLQDELVKRIDQAVKQRFWEDRAAVLPEDFPAGA